MKWIKIIDRLPEVNQDVLLFTNSGVIEGSREESEDLEWGFIVLDAHGCG